MTYLYYTVVIVVILAVIGLLPLVFGSAINRWSHSTTTEDYIAGLGFMLVIAAGVGFMLLICKSFIEVFK